MQAATVEERPAIGGRGRRWKVLVGIAGGVAAVVALILLGRSGGDHLPAFAAWVEAQGAWGPLAFIAGYAVATVALVPGSLLTLAAGAVFRHPDRPTRAEKGNR